MKNKRLIWTLVFLAILTLGSIGTDLFKKEQQNTNKVVKVGILQFVTHDALDQIEKGIEDGLKEAGYKGDKVQIPLLNAEGINQRFKPCLNNWSTTRTMSLSVLQRQQLRG